MSAEEFTFTLNADFGTELKIVRMEGTEAAGKLFEYRIEFIDYVEGGAEDNDPISSDDVIGTEASAKWKFDWSASGFEEGEVLERDVHGFCAQFRVLGTLSTYYHYEVTLKPRLWLAGRKTNSRLFLDKTLTQIIETVLDDSEVTNRRCEFDHASEQIHYVVQYQETDLDFISRLLERHGSTYFFEHTDSAHTVVFRNATGEVSSLGDVEYRRHGGGIAHGRYVNRISAAAGLFPDTVKLRDFDPESAGAPLEADDQLAGQHSSANNEVYVYPGGWTHANSAHGSDLARYMVEAEVAESKRVVLGGYVPDMIPGAKFDLAENLAAEARGYIVLSAHHVVDVMAHFRTGDESETDEENFGYRGTYVAVPDDVPYPPRRTTPWPQIVGPQTAIVDGDDDIDIDDYGRITVLFHWDRDQTRSCRIRVAQLWAGNKWGAVFVPRKGMEVVVEYMGGDPDRPLVTGCVYNSVNENPVLPADKTRSGIRSSGGDASSSSEWNFWAFDDKAGEEEIYIHAQKDMFRKVLNDDKIEIDNDQTIEIGNDRTTDVGNNDTLNVGSTLKIEANTKIELKVGGSTITMEPAKITIKSVQIEVNGSAKSEVKGAMVDINGSAMTKIQGGLVKIN